MADYVWPPAPVGAVFLVTYHMSWCGQKLMNTFHYTMISNAGNIIVEQAYNNLETRLSAVGGVTDKHAALRDSNCNLTQITIQMVHPQRYVSKAFVKNIPGTIVGANDTPNLHATISRRAVGGTRRDMGHVHIPIPIDVSVFLDGSLTAAYKVKLTELAVAMDTTLGPVGLDQYDPCLFNKDNVPPVRIIGTTAPKDEVRCSRRRTVGLGI